MSEDALPSALLDQRLAIVGRTGAGKSYAARGAVERLLTDGARVAIIDPTGIWWGLRSAADGTAPGYPVIVFGGLHADVALQEGMGASLGRLIGRQAIACVVDLSELGSTSARRRFMGGFLDAIYATNREPLHLVFDEADMLAPQQPMPEWKGLLGHMEEIVRRGRVRGFTPWLITQRPAVLHKDVLSQADVLIAMNLTSSQDRDAIGAWIEGQADRTDGKRILADLPRLPRGTGYVWAPAFGILDRVTFPSITTFDSSRTPARGERLVAPRTLADVDLTAITTALAADAERHAPKGKHAAPGPDHRAAIEAADAAGYARGLADGRAAVWAEIKDRVEDIAAAVAGLRHADLSDAKAWRNEIAATPPAADVHAGPARISRNGREPQVPRKSAGGAGGAGELNSAARKLLTASVQHAPAKFTWGQLATIAGLKPSGGHFNTGRKQLLDAGLIDDPGDLVHPTPEGIGVIGETPPAPSTAAERLAMWCARLPSPAPDMLRALARHGLRFIDPTDLAAELGKEPRGGHWNTGVAMLKANLLVELQGRSMRAAGLLRP